MGDKSRIEWTDATWNPITGCTPISEGCANCYAKRMAETRLAGRMGYDKDDPFKVTFHPDKLDQPSRWAKPRKIFVCSMGDLFHEDVPVEWIARVWAMMWRSAPWTWIKDDPVRTMQGGHVFMVLTKRPRRMAELLNKESFWNLVIESGALSMRAVEPVPHIWLGVTAENQARADERIPILLDTPAAVRFVSVEPMLGPVDLRGLLVAEGKAGSPYLDALDARQLWLPSLDWVICGGETGQNARPMHPDWARALRDQCVAARVPFFFKQWGEWGVCKEVECPTRSGACESPKETFCGGMCKMGKKRSGRLLDGRTWDEYPEARG